MLRNIQESQLARAFSQDFIDDLPGADCPSAEELWLACTLELDVKTRVKIIDHCISCPHCAQELRLTREMVAEHNELLLGAPANSTHPDLPRIRLADSGASAPLRVVGEASADLAEQEAQEEQSSPISLSGWRRNLNKVAAGCGVLAAAAALAFIVVKDREPRSESGGAWRGQEQQTQEASYRFSGKAFSWPAESKVEQYEVEIKSAARGAGAKCVQTVPSNRLTVEALRCPGLSLTQPFFWRVRPITKQGQGQFSRFFAVKDI